jgi:DNA-3-methyladenine glycosylase
MFEKIVPIEFFQQSTEIVAKQLIGKLFVRHIDAKIILAAEIIETEAYLPTNDPACHASLKKTKRNAPMFEDGGILYVYFIYGNHFCSNIVTEKKEQGAAVLIRAGRPVLGINVMQKNRGIIDEVSLCKGPGNFAKAFGLNKSHNYLLLDGSHFGIYYYNNYLDEEITQTTRIGIKKATELPLRYYLTNSKFVSKK